MPVFCFFLRGMKTKKSKQNKKQQDHKMQTRKRLSLVTIKKESRNHRHKAIQPHCLDWKQTHKEENNHKNIKHRNKLPFNQHDSTKKTRIEGETFFIV